MFAWMCKYNSEDWSGKCVMWGKQGVKRLVLTKLTAWPCMPLWKWYDKQFIVHSPNTAAVKTCEDVTDFAWLKWIETPMKAALNSCQVQEDS